MAYMTHIDQLDCGFEFPIFEDPPPPYSPPKPSDDSPTEAPPPYERVSSNDSHRSSGDSTFDQQATSSESYEQLGTSCESGEQGTSVDMCNNEGTSADMIDPHETKSGGNVELGTGWEIVEQNKRSVQNINTVESLERIIPVIKNVESKMANKDLKSNMVINDVKSKMVNKDVKSKMANKDVKSKMVNKNVKSKMANKDVNCEMVIVDVNKSSYSNLCAKCKGQSCSSSARLTCSCGAPLRFNIEEQRDQFVLESCEEDNDSPQTIKPPDLTRKVVSKIVHLNKTESCLKNSRDGILELC